MWRVLIVATNRGCVLRIRQELPIRQQFLTTHSNVHCNQIANLRADGCTSYSALGSRFARIAVNGLARPTNSFSFAIVSQPQPHGSRIFKPRPARKEVLSALAPVLRPDCFDEPAAVGSRHAAGATVRWTTPDSSQKSRVGQPFINFPTSFLDRFERIGFGVAQKSWANLVSDHYVHVRRRFEIFAVKASSCVTLCVVGNDWHSTQDYNLVPMVYRQA